MKKLQFAIFGCGFWSQFQLGAWTELEGAECVALYNRTLSKAEKLAQRFDVPRVYDDAAELLKKEKLDFIDIITNPETHAEFVELAAEHGVKKIICQKPMAPDYETAKRMMKVTRQAGIKFYIHENFRWQRPIRRYKELLDSGIIGTPFKARVSFLSSYPVFENQPFLAESENFIITDMGSHTLDVTRFLFGECQNLWCQTRTINPHIKGEDVAVVMMQMENGMPIYNEMSYASIVEHDTFTTVFLLTEGEKGSLYLGRGNEQMAGSSEGLNAESNFEIRLTTNEKTTTEVITISDHAWADPAYLVNHDSGVPINKNILDDMMGKGQAENTGKDNFETVKLVWASYESAEKGKIIDLTHF